MDLTVADILESKNLAKAKVVAGQRGLTKKVNSVTVGEVPDIADWLEGGEIVLSTLYAVGEKTADQLKFIDKLIKAKASALMVKPKRFIGKLDPKILELAEKKNFPLIEVPPQVRWTEIVGQIYHQIIGQHLAFQKRSFNIHRQLLNEVIKGGSYESIAKTAASLTGKPVLLEDADYKLLAAANLKKEYKDMLEKFAEIEDSEELGHSFRLQLEKGKRYPAKVSVPIVVEQNTLGFVSALETKEPLNELDLIALEHVATITAVEMGKERIKFETEMRLKGDFIDDLITKQFQPSEVLLKRASFLGCDLSRGALVLIVDIDDFDSLLEKGSYSEDEIQRIRREFFNTCNWIVDLEYKGSLVSLKSDSVVVFMTQAQNTADGLSAQALKVAGSLQKGLKSRFEKFTFSIGISNYYNKPEKIEKAFSEAKIALDISKKLGQKEKITDFNKVGTYKLLTSLLDNNADELKSFYEETIASLVDYDRRHGSELVKTLEAFFQNNENINLAAKALFAHRHTVRYRLERIKELTGLSIYSSDEKERLALGLKLSRLLS